MIFIDTFRIKVPSFDFSNNLLNCGLLGILKLGEDNSLHIIRKNKINQKNNLSK